jgi:response regulator RpfG family c-di-GMP phosphodiesterase
MLALQDFKVNQANYRIIISDYRMPAINGTEFLSTINEINPSVMRMLISKFEAVDKISEQFNCVDRYLQSPLKFLR